MIPSTVSSIGSTWIRLPYFTSGQGWMLQQKKTPVSHIMLDSHPSLEKAVMPLPRPVPMPERTLQSPGETFHPHKNISMLTRQKSCPSQASIHNIHPPSLLSALSKAAGEFHAFFLPALLFCSHPQGTFTSY